MKKTTFIAVAFSALFFASCGDSSTKKTETTAEETTTEETTTEEVVATEEASIVGDWKLTNADFGMEIPEEQKEMFDAMIKAMIESTTMTFNADGTYENKSKVNGQENIENGTYTLDGMSLTTVSSKEKTDVITLSELTASTMSFSVEDNGSKMTMTFGK